MNKLIPLLFTALLLYCLPMFGQTHEIRRPTADSTSTSLCGPDQAIGAVNLTAPSMPNAYDASGTSTSSSESVTGAANQQYVGRHFTTFPFPSGSYTSLTVNVNASGTDSNGNIFIGVSTDAGSSVNFVKRDTNAGGFAQQTFSVALSTGQNLGNLQVVACALGNSPSGTASVTVFDVWTDGVLAVTAPAAPTGLSATVTNGVVNLSWTDNSTNESGFKVDNCVGDQTICTSDSVATLTHTTGANATTDSVATLTGKKTYTFWVKGTNTAGDSSPSNAVTIPLPGGGVQHITSP